MLPVSEFEPENIFSSLLEDLNPPQREAAEHFEGPILVLAGAGSGKTRVLTRRVAHLIQHHHIYPDRILAVTFTNKASEEMRERLHSLLGEQAKRIWIATFHSAALRMLRRHPELLGYKPDFVVYDDQDTKSILKKILAAHNIDDKRFPPQLFSKFIDQCKNNLILPETALGQAKDFAAKQQAEVYEHYQRELMRANAMDFGDLLLNAVLLLQRNPEILALYRNTLHFILVDEFQDTNKVQYLFIRYLSEPRRNLLVVGDDDQSIYAFRGATIRNILEFEKDFPDTKVIKLEQNYRSTANVLTASHAVIEKNRSRKSKKLWTDQPAGDPISLFVGGDEGEEASFIVRKIAARRRAGMPYKKMAIFYRTNAQSRAIEEALVAAQIPYRMYGGLKFYERKEIKDILGYLKLLMNPDDNQAFFRTVNTPPRGIGAQSIQHIVDAADATGISYLSSLRNESTRSKGTAIFVKLIDELSEIAKTKPLSELISAIIERSEYGPKLRAMKDPAAQSRVENLQELVAIGRGMEVSGTPPLETLKLFLDRVSLTSSADIPDGSAEGQDKTDAVSLMTLHLCKGLEFPLVFLTGAEEGLLPHYRSLLDAVAIEEERRLCYVGITRAMEELCITRAKTRGMFSAGSGFGATGMLRNVSRFIKDVPPEVLQDLTGEFFEASITVGLIKDNSDSFSGSGWGGSADRNMGWQRRSTESTNRAGLSGKVGGQKINTSKDAARGYKTRFLGTPMIKPADALQEPSNHRDWSPTLEAAKPEDIQVGAKVVHPVFGSGTIEAADTPDTAPGKMKISIRFNETDEVKKLIFKFASLAKSDF
jgi:DNA helicase-2/ATP-dependent DNA helicase PcrA